MIEGTGELCRERRHTGRARIENATILRSTRKLTKQGEFEVEQILSSVPDERRPQLWPACAARANERSGILGLPNPSQEDWPNLLDWKRLSAKLNGDQQLRLPECDRRQVQKPHKLLSEISVLRVQLRSAEFHIQLITSIALVVELQ